MRGWLYALVVLGVASMAVASDAAVPKPPIILAAASLQDVLTAEADAWAKRGHAQPVIAFAASSALAKQIESGAPADIFISADEAWMDDVAAKNDLIANTRIDLATNQLVLIAPTASNVRLAIAPNFALSSALGQGRLAIADPDSVPAGKYAKASLTALDVWQSVSGRTARAENARAALALVARGEAPLGIVYATDARATPAVRVVSTFPASTHPRISYPMALLKTSSSADALPFKAFLKSKLGQSIFRRFGFGPV